MIEVDERIEINNKKEIEDRKKAHEKVKAILDDFARTTDQVVSLDELKSKLIEGKQLIVKYGADCTAPFLHLGHAVNLWMMRRLQDEGHKIIFLLGDFTTKIGDPTGKSKTRPVIPDEEIEKNAQEFIKQVGNILITDNQKLFEVRRNSEWFDKMPVRKFLSLISMVTHSRLASRDMFQKRLQQGSEIYMHEMLYPILQGYDSVELKSDLTIVGTDQLFNESIGRFYQDKFGQNPQVILTTKITPGLCGKVKQSKSLGNYVAITDTPRNKLGKLMSLPDHLILEWMEVYTKIPLETINEYKKEFNSGKADFRNMKLELAKAVVERYHGKDAANTEVDWFIKTFSSREFPKDAPIVPLRSTTYPIIGLLKQCMQINSNSKIRELIQQGAVRINDEKVQDLDAQISIAPCQTVYLKVGKKNFYKLEAIS